MEPRKLVLTIETETMLPLKTFRAMRDTWLSNGYAYFRVTQIHANVVKPPVKSVKKGRKP